MSKIPYYDCAATLSDAEISKLLSTSWNIPYAVRELCNTYTLLFFDHATLSASLSQSPLHPEEYTIHAHGGGYKVTWDKEAYAAYKFPHRWDSEANPLSFVISLRSIGGIKHAIIQRQRKPRRGPMNTIVSYKDSRRDTL